MHGTEEIRYNLHGFFRIQGEYGNIIDYFIPGGKATGGLYRDGNPGGVNNNFNFPKALYDLRRDPGERYDLLEFYPEIAEKLEEIAMKAREDLGDDLRDMPGKNRREPGLVE